LGTASQCPACPTRGEAKKIGVIGAPNISQFCLLSAVTALGPLTLLPVFISTLAKRQLNVPGPCFSHHKEYELSAISPQGLFRLIRVSRR